MPTRLLKENVLDSPTLDALSPAAEAMWFRLLAVVDDYGRHDARPVLLRSKVYPTREEVTPEEVARWLAELAKAGAVTHYVVDGRPYLEVKLFTKHQKVRAKTSKCPPPPPDADSCPQMPASAGTPRTPASNCQQPPAAAPPMPAIADACPSRGRESESESESESKTESLGAAAPPAGIRPPPPTLASICQQVPATPDPHKPAKRFTPPTVDEVIDYVNDKGLPVDAVKFHAYYSSNGWKVGKNPMKDWHAALTTWSRNPEHPSAGKPIAQSTMKHTAAADRALDERKEW